MATYLADAVWMAFNYNKKNFQYDRKFRQKMEYKVVDMKLEQVDLWRDDVRTMVELTLTKCEVYLLVVTLLLTCCVTALCKGRVPAGTPTWLAACHTVSLTGAFMYLFLALWLGMHAYVSAQAYKVRILTHYVRLPIPQWQTIEAARTYSSAFEKMQGDQILRVPFVMGAQESRVGQGRAESSAPRPDIAGSSLPQSSGDTSEVEPVAPAPTSADPWGVERQIDSGSQAGPGIAELAPDVNARTELQRHVWYVREAAQFYETSDAFCRIAMSTGTCSLAIFLCYFCLSYVLTENGSPVAAWAGMMAFLAISLVLVRLDMRLTGWLYFGGSCLMVLPPFISAMVVYENSKQLIATRHLEWLMPLVPFFHGVWYLAYLACFDTKAELPHAFRSVLYLDAFGWARHESSPSTGASTTGASPAPLVRPSAFSSVRGMMFQHDSEAVSGRPSMQVLNPTAPCRPEERAPQPTSTESNELANVSFAPSTFASNEPGPDGASNRLANNSSGDNILGISPGALPWFSYKWTTRFLAILWFWSTMSHVFVLATEGERVDAFGTRFGELKRKLEHSSLISAHTNGTKIKTIWGSPLVRPRGLDCDQLGARFMTSGLDSSGETTLMTAELSSQGLNFQSMRQCLGKEEFLEDLAGSCGLQDKGCIALALPRQGKRLVSCPLSTAHAQELQESPRKMSLSSKLANDLALPLHRVWLDDRGASSIDRSPFTGELVDDVHGLPEEMSAVIVIPCGTGTDPGTRCIVVGTTARRVVLLAATRLSRSSTQLAWVPRQILSHDVGEVPGPGAFALFTGRHLGVLLRNASRLQLLDLQNGGAHSDSIELPKERRWASVCAGGGSLFALEDGTDPTLWRFTAPTDLDKGKTA